MPLNHKGWKRWVRGGVIFLLLIDLGLLLGRWRIAASASRKQLSDTRQNLKTAAEKLSANLDEAAAIRQHLPQVKQDCDGFYTHQLLDFRDGYAAVVADLGEIAGKAGLRTEGVRFQQKDLPKRGVTEVEATATIEGDYPSLVRFIDGLERSQNFYLLDSLALASSTGGRIKLNVQLRTYFRS
jgi:Tfp pilus assembly protein PilO